MYKPKEPEKVKLHDDDEDVETEWDDVLQQATEEELVDLAGRLKGKGVVWKGVGVKRR